MSNAKQLSLHQLYDLNFLLNAKRLACRSYNALFVAAGAFPPTIPTAPLRDNVKEKWRKAIRLRVIGIFIVVNVTTTTFAIMLGVN